jgi:hypothetical protein
MRVDWRPAVALGAIVGGIVVAGYGFSLAATNASLNAPTPTPPPYIDQIRVGDCAKIIGSDEDPTILPAECDAGGTTYLLLKILRKPGVIIQDCPGSTTTAIREYLVATPRLFCFQEL